MSIFLRCFEVVRSRFLMVFENGFGSVRPTIIWSLLDVSKGLKIARILTAIDSECDIDIFTMF